MRTQPAVTASNSTSRTMTTGQPIATQSPLTLPGFSESHPDESHRSQIGSKPRHADVVGLGQLRHGRPMRGPMDTPTAIKQLTDEQRLEWLQLFRSDNVG